MVEFDYTEGKLSALEQKIENDIRKQISDYSYMGKTKERTTLDGEWTEEELEADLEDEAMAILNGDKHKGTKGWIEEHKFRAVKDKDLLYSEYLANMIREENDLIVLYNTEYDKHRNDTNRKFGIHYFDEAIRKKMKDILKDNLITK